MIKILSATVAALYASMVEIAMAEAAKGTLFTSFHNDLFEIDKDVLFNDAHPEDCWLWAVKACGTWFTLVHPDNREGVAAVLGTTQSNERLFLVRVPGQGHAGGITEHTHADIGAAIARVKPLTERPPRRMMLAQHMNALRPGVWRNTVIGSDISVLSDRVGIDIYVRRCGTSMIEVAVPATGYHRSLGCRMGKDVDASKLTVTTRFGHAICTPIPEAQFKRALTRALAKQRIAA